MMKKSKYPLSFRTNYFRPLKVFRNKISFPKDFFRTVTIPAKQIASVEKVLNDYEVEFIMTSFQDLDKISYIYALD